MGRTKDGHRPTGCFECLKPPVRPLPILPSTLSRTVADALTEWARRPATWKVHKPHRAEPRAAANTRTEGRPGRPPPEKAHNQRTNTGRGRAATRAAWAAHCALHLSPYEGGGIYQGRGGEASSAARLTSRASPPGKEQITAHC